MRRILVLRGGALGDFVVTLPALAALRARFPEAHIELVGNATAAALAVSRGIINAVHSQQDARWAELYTRVAISPDLARWLGGFDLVISFWPDPDRELADRFPLHPEQRFVAGAALPLTRPAARHFTAALAPLELPAVSDWVRLHPLVTTHVPGKSQQQRTVVLHPGSGSPRKNWPLARWAELAAWLSSEHSVALQIVSGPAESVAPLPGVGTALRDRSLEDLVGHLAGCSLFIGHDSGISHLAAACGARCVLLFGPTDPRVWAPPSPSVTVVSYGSDLAILPLATVQQAVRMALS